MRESNVRVSWLSCFGGAGVIPPDWDFQPETLSWSYRPSLCSTARGTGNCKQLVLWLTHSARMHLKKGLISSSDKEELKLFYFDWNNWILIGPWRENKRPARGLERLCRCQVVLKYFIIINHWSWTSDLPGECPSLPVLCKQPSQLQHLLNLAG